MDKRAALKAAAATAALLIVSVLAGLAFAGRRLWACVVLAVILVGVFGYGYYNIFKD